MKPSLVIPANPVSWYGAGARNQFFVFLFFFSSFPVLAAKRGPVDQLGYIETRNGVTQALWGRKIGNEIVVDQRKGNLPVQCLEKSPGYAGCLGLPALEIKQEAVLKNEESFLGETLQHFETNWLLKAQMETLPLNEEETRLNTLLRPFGIDQIFLEGHGAFLFFPKKEEKIAEKVILSGFLVKNGEKASLQIEWVSGRGPW